MSADLEKKLFENGMGIWKVQKISNNTLTLFKDINDNGDVNMALAITLHLTKDHINSFMKLSINHKQETKTATISINDADESLLWPNNIWQQNKEGIKISQAIELSLKPHLNETIKTINFFEP